MKSALTKLTKNHPLPLAVALLALLCASPLNAAPYNPPVLKPATNGSRFLFVFEMSSAMKATDAANRQALFDLIFSGFEGQMRHGDSFGLWLFNEEIRAGEFPLQVWDEENTLEIASRATQFIRAQKYAGKARMEDILPRIMGLARSVRDVHLVIISTGEQQIHGTPFDVSINETYARRHSERRKTEKPFVTTLNVRTGKVVSASVTLGSQYIKLPDRPTPIVAAPVGDTNKLVAATAPTSAPPTMVIEARSNINLTGVAPTKVWTPSSRASSNAGPGEIAILSHVPGTDAAAALAQGNPANPPGTQALPPVEPATTIATLQPLPAPVTLPPSNPAPANPPVAVATVISTPPTPQTPERVPSTPPPAETASPVVEAIAVPVAARAPADSNVGSFVNSPGAVLVIEPPLSPVVLLGIGAALLGACLALLVVVLRRLRPPAHGSLITQSMDRH